MNLYDILTNLNAIQPQINLRQLLALAPCCKSELGTSLLQKLAKVVNFHDIFMDFEAPIVFVFIDGFVIQGAQIDSWSSISLMSIETIEEIGLNTMSTTPIILRMIYQSRIKSLGVVRRVPTLI